MWDQIGRVCSEEMQAKCNNFKQNCDDRRKRNNYTNTLKELAQMLPIPLRTSCKRLTKKEILLRVLRYIEHLQTNINRARSLLQGRGEEQKAGSQPVVIPALKRERREVTPRAKNPKPLAVYKKPRKRRRMRKSDRRGGVNRKVCKYLALESGKDSTHAVPHLEEESLPDTKFLFLSLFIVLITISTVFRQELVHYHSSCEEEEEEEPKASPWLCIQSPLKFSNVLFEDAYLSPQCSSFSHTPAGTLLRKSAFTLDHCYLSYSEAGKTESSPMSRVNEILSSWSEQIQEEPPLVRTEGPGSSSEENSDSTWTPSFPRAKALPGGPPRKKSRKKQKQKKKVAGAGRRARRPPAGAEKRSNASSPPLQLKKKCVNGFIMFCRLNRKHFIRRLNNRIVRDDFSSGDEEPEPPKPFHLLLAEKSIPGTQTVGNVSLLGCIP
ncbi:hypothetical protein L345_11080, partial [Ophiophagus hannah]